MQLNSACAFFKIESGFLKLTQLKSATFFYSHQTINLINNKVRPFDLFEMKEMLSSFKLLQSFDKPVVIVNYYELGEVLELNEVPEKTPLCLILEFEKCEEITTLKLNSNCPAYEITPTSSISLSTYTQMFNRVRNHLLDGDCYQLNLTHQFDFSLRGSLESLASKFLSSELLSEYAHLINLPQIDLMILSNSPESLFSIKDDVLSSRPIKGTMSLERGQEALEQSEKDKSELSIITDLIRNDLSRIGTHFSKVKSALSFFKVPGLVHQYSEIEVNLDSDINLFSVISAIFPGGSITGAPKKRVVSLIRDIEQSPRGLYTGSTVLLYKSHREASINIRTAVVSHSSKSISYGAGGGITLKSNATDEYDEMFAKLKSFFSNII